MAGEREHIREIEQLLSGARSAPDDIVVRAPSPATGWNISEAARGLGVDRTTVHRRMKRLRLEAPN